MMSDLEEAKFALSEANYWIILGLLKSIVEANLLPPDKVKEIIQQATVKSIPTNFQSGGHLEGVRTMLVDLSTAISGFPEHFGEKKKSPRHEV